MFLHYLIVRTYLYCTCLLISVLLDLLYTVLHFLIALIEALGLLRRHSDGLPVSLKRTTPSCHLCSAVRSQYEAHRWLQRRIKCDSALTTRKNKRPLPCLIFSLYFKPFVFRPWVCSRWNVLKVVCEIGKFTIRDAILFHTFCIFNKEYFVFLAPRMFGCRSFFGWRLCVCFLHRADGDLSLFPVDFDVCIKVLFIIVSSILYLVPKYPKA